MDDLGILSWIGNLQPRHIIWIRAADGVLSTRTGSALLDALSGESGHHAILVVVHHIASRLRSLPPSCHSPHGYRML